MHVPWKRLAQALILLLAVGSLAAVLWRQWSALQAYHWQVRPGWALAGIAGLELVWLFEAATWNAILRGLGGRLANRRAARVWFLSAIVRYIPGNVWQYLGMVELAAEDGVPRAATLASTAVHQIICTATGVALAALYFAVAGQAAWLVRLRPLLLLIPLGLLLLQPRLIERGLNWLLVRLKRRPLQITLTWAGIWLLVLRYVLVWLGEGLSYVALVRALVPFGWDAAPHLVGVWWTAYIAGYLSMITPSGLGVREATMTLLLGSVIPASIAAVVAIATRLLMIVAEALAAGAVLLLARWNQPARLAGAEARLPVVDEGQVANGPS